jgi:alpha/beta superfamily hydrolase
MAGPSALRKRAVPGAAGHIEAVFSEPDQPRIVAVVAHPHPLFGGTMDNKVVTTVARAFHELDAITWRFNFRGVGGTQGAHDEGRGETDDMLAVIAAARAEHPELPLLLAGFSFGGAVALRASCAADFEQLVLMAPGFRRFTEQGMGEAPDPNDPGLGAPGRHTHANTYIVHGDLDETVPLADSLAWAAVREIPVVVIPGADHFFHRKLHVIRDVVSRMTDL